MNLTVDVVCQDKHLVPTSTRRDLFLFSKSDSEQVYRQDMLVYIQQNVMSPIISPKRSLCLEISFILCMYVYSVSLSLSLSLSLNNTSFYDQVC